jgi:hypothetical protein
MVVALRLLGWLVSADYEQDGRAKCACAKHYMEAEICGPDL